MPITAAPRVFPLTTAGSASTRTHSHLDHSGPGFFHACIVPFWMTTVPGRSMSCSVPSSNIRTSFPLTADRGRCVSKCTKRVCSEMMLTQDVVVDRRRSVLFPCEYPVYPIVRIVLTQVAVAPGAKSVTTQVVPPRETMPRSPSTVRVAPSVLRSFSLRRKRCGADIQLTLHCCPLPARTWLSIPSRF